MKKKLLVLLIICLASVIVMTGCDPVLALKPEYAYSDIEIDLGEKLPEDIESYIDFSELSDEEARFVHENTELLFDGEKVAGQDFNDAGHHTLTINYCGMQYRKYNVTITDKLPPVFTKSRSLYTFVGLRLNDDLLDQIFEAEDNSGKCNIEADIPDVDYNNPGEYELTAVATDPSGNTAEASAKVTVQKPHYGAKGTYVYVSIPDQTLTYFVDGEVAMSTPVVTGNAANHSTPRGTYRLLNKATNVTLKGMEDDGKTEYESYVNYWMAFIGSNFGLHDATWRSCFGGNIYRGNGSHGCVNMPLARAGELFGMIEMGTPILVY